jgi:hypothetical protein
VIKNGITLTYGADNGFRAGMICPSLLEKNACPYFLHIVKCWSGSEGFSTASDYQAKELSHIHT